MHADIHARVFFPLLKFVGTSTNENYSFITLCLKSLINFMLIYFLQSY